MDIYERIRNTGIIPIVTVKNEESALMIANGLNDGGLSCAEFTFRTDAAEAAILSVTKQLPNMLIGAGTVLTPEQVDRAIDAGAKFMVSPGINADIVEYCMKKNVPIFPGVSTASDIDLASRLGLEVVKFFPSETTGGLPNIKALAAPFPKMMFIPTGGINIKNLANYLSFNKVFACGGSWMTGSDMSYDDVKESARKAIEVMLGFEFAHIGINEKTDEEADTLAKLFCNAFSLEYIMKVPSIFAGTPIEVMKHGGLGRNGHLGFSTNDVERAIFHLEARGFTFDAKTARINENNHRTFIYFSEEFGGFAVHIVER